MLSIKNAGHVTSNLARLPSTLNRAAPYPPERRVEERLSIERSGEIQHSLDTLSDAMIQDLSVQGCSIRCVPGDIRMGQYVVVRLAGTSTIPGIVRWARDGSVGVEFLHTIASDVAEGQTPLSNPVSISHLR